MAAQSIPRRREAVTDWLADGVEKYHRTIGTYVTALTSAGFVIDGLIEWAPSPADVVAHPEWTREVERPSFLVVSARFGTEQ